jgi:hypothetical protein
MRLIAKPAVENEQAKPVVSDDADDDRGHPLELGSCRVFPRCALKLELHQVAEAEQRGEVVGLPSIQRVHVGAGDFLRSRVQSQLIPQAGRCASVHHHCGIPSLCARTRFLFARFLFRPDSLSFRLFLFRPLSFRLFLFRPLSFRLVIKGSF